MPSLVNISKTSSSLTNISKNLSAIDRGLYFLLQESLNYLLQENGDKIVLEQSSGYKNLSSLTNMQKI